MTQHPPRHVRIGIDVGGTFTDAVVVDARSFELLGQVKVPTSHDHADGVAHGILEALEKLQADVGIGARDVSFLAHGTTQATNALLEGDVATVGIAGIGAGFDGFATRRLTALGKLELAPGRRLPIRYAAVRDASDPVAVKEALARLRAEGAEVIVAVEPFSVDDPEGEQAVLDAAREQGLLGTSTHEITSLYGLTKRARTAVLNAGIMPRMVSTADLVEASVQRAGITAPLMVMRGDGGVMSLPEMRRRPLLTALSGPAAGVAGALMGEKLSEGVFLETGGTSTDISVIRRGRVQVRHAHLAGRETYLPALDVRTVGIGGGSLIRFSGRAVTDVGPRSAHIAGLAYACFAPASALTDAKLVTISPRPDDPADYVALEAPDGTRYALTLTCAANALGIVPAGSYARSEPESARLAVQPLAQALAVPVEEAARTVLRQAIKPVRDVVDELAREYQLDHLTLVGGGGGAAAVTPFLGEEAEQDWRIAAHSEVISPLGAALALVRESVERIVPGPSNADILAARAEAEAAVIAQGADPSGVEVDVTVDPRRNLIRAIATGATELRTKDRASTVDEGVVRGEVARSIGVPVAEVEELAAAGQHRVFGARARRKGPLGRFAAPVRYVRVVDGEGVIRLHSTGAAVEQTDVASAQSRLATLVDQHTHYGDGGSRAPALWLLAGPKIADLSGVLDRDQLVALIGAELKTRAPAEPVVAILEDRK
ncbi:hydantoinase/oxoprolinase family protein [Amycolatopsis acidiphila]|uniref:Hydantoinase/oxoprolinase family protein n=1 Tax=Amycolatopsis acidiphila TaxID=715473 RepID=A0A558A1L2_9PSEU|nr:hydantoinase/oxoprolinase family protein [Amycolatopsis acidiphila]TVT18136.1 hydantoinase/oxoprolinase family protein [Amycolatopsis acidiphila]UIJ61948.1 hydantoinase/oxoprolinase family protein [Amycolatopsis acidiphila]GHG56974.1 ATP-utilizing protein [Amycolatopsis acidiphila]